MIEIIKGDKTCSKCGGKYFSSKATQMMIDNDICYKCTLNYYRYIFGTGERPTVEEWKNANLQV